MKQRIITGVVLCRAIHSHRNIRWRAFTVLVYALASIGLYELIRMNKLTLISVPTVLAAVLLWILLIPSSASKLFTWIGLGKLEITFVIVLLLYHIQSFLRIHLLLIMLHFTDGNDICGNGILIFK